SAVAGSQRAPEATERQPTTTDAPPRPSTNSYYVEEYLGKGGYGVVAKCFNVETEEIVAIKVYHEYVQKEEVERELECLKKLQQVDPDEHNLVKFIDHLKYKGQLCLVFEMLGSHLVDFMISREWKPLNVAEIRPIAQQLLVALEALKSIGLVHADIKPDNIVFVNLLQSLKVKLIDFGCAAEASKLEEFDSIQVPGFRAPEAILGLPLTEAVDMWAVGAVLALLFLGRLLYPYESAYEQLRIMVRVQGLPKDHLLKTGRKARRFFTECHEPFGQAWRMKTPYEYQQERRNQVTRCSSYFEEFSCIDDMLHAFKEYMDPTLEEDTKAFLSLLKQMLDIDPNKRITPSTALGHRFITSKVRSSNEASTSDNDTEGSTKAALDQGRLISSHRAGNLR
uniref:Protein kinase domain-containing protein n=1 Tax=Acanthochromis polyacanthus TaxID=80966 RepID=A0A3Q1GTD3_9TELE